MTTGKNRPLVVNIEQGEIVIRVGIDTLAHAVASGDRFHRYDKYAHKYFRSFAITDTEKFADDCVAAMLEESENGATRLSRFFDNAAERAIEDGSQGVKYKQKIEWGKKAIEEKF